MCVRTSDGEAIAALSVSAPSFRYTPERAGVFVRELTATVRRPAAEAISGRSSEPAVEVRRDDPVTSPASDPGIAKPFAR